MKGDRRARRYGPLLLALGVVMIIAAWAVAARVIAAVIILPGPGETVVALWSQMTNRSFYGHLAGTVARTMVGFAAAFAVGLAWGLLRGSSNLAGPVLLPALVLIRSTPVIAIILLALIWFRASLAPVFVTWLMVVPVVVENVTAGTRAASGQLREMASVYRVPRSRRIRELTLPALRPYLFASAHAGLGMAYKVTVAAEVIVQPRNALGGAMQEARFYLDTPRILALTLAVIAVSALTESLLRTIERLAPGLRRGRASASPADHAIVSRDGAARARIAAPAAAQPVLVSEVSRSYGAHLVFAGLSVAFEPGEITVVLGPSGCGKTTLLRLIAGLDEPHSGAIEAPECRSMVFQEPRLLPWADAAANIEFVLAGTDAARVRESLQLARLPLHGAAYPDALSGGMQQRLSLARAFAYCGQMLLLDEPFQNLDLAVKLELAGQVRTVTAGCGVTIMVTHDVVEALATGDRIIIMAGTPGRIVGEERVDLDTGERDPRCAAHQRHAARLYDVLLSAR